jgi:serine protease Do
VALASIVSLLIAGAALFLASHLVAHHSAVPLSRANKPRKSAVPTQTVGTSTPAPSGFAARYRRESPGVLKIVASTCGGTGIGTGFLLPSGMIATVAHVVTGAVSVAITGNGETSAATIVGYDAVQDLALLRPSKPFDGYAFTWAAQEPSVGDQVAAIGYPLDQPETLTTGTVSGLNRKVPVEGILRTGLIETDTPINPGNSGGPLFATDGTVVGLVDAVNAHASGIGYAVDAQRARPEISGWQASPSPQPARPCAKALGPSGGAVIGNPASSSEAASITSTLVTYFDAINNGDYATAYAQLDTHAQSQGSLKSFASDDSTSYDFNFSLRSITTKSPGVDLATLDFTSIQDASKGPNRNTCDNWTLNYAMVNTGGAWLIDSATGQNGVTHTAC